LTNAAPPSQGDQPMANLYREHLTIIDEMEVGYNIRHFFGRAVLVTPAPSPEAPLPIPGQIHRSALRDVVLHNTGGRASARECLMLPDRLLAAIPFTRGGHSHLGGTIHPYWGTCPCPRTLDARFWCH